MAMKSKKLSVSGVVEASDLKVLGISMKPNSTNDGTIDVRDVDASGSILIALETTGGGNDSFVSVPGGGIQFGSNCYVEMANVDAITVFYDDMS